MDIVEKTPISGPTNTFFVTKFAKQSNYSFQPIIINFDAVGEYFFATIPNHGKRILRMWLNMDSVPISNLLTFEVFIEKVLVYSWTGEYIQIHNSIRTPIQKKLPGYVLIPIMQYFPVIENTQIRMRVSGGTNFSLVADWVYDTLPIDGEYVINQVQTLQADPTNAVRLNFKNVVKELIIVVQDRCQPALTFTDQIASMRLELNGKQKFDDQGIFFKYIQPMMYHTGNQLGVYLYSFSLFPEDEMPSGGINFSRINNQILKINLLNPGSKTMRVYALSYNILKIKDKRASITYDNT
jgi:hypothetical protein